VTPEQRFLWRWMTLHHETDFALHYDCSLVAHRRAELLDQEALRVGRRWLASVLNYRHAVLVAEAEAEAEAVGAT
jgi:hypothetical protein